MSAAAPPPAAARERPPSEAWLSLVPPSSSAASLAWARRARALGPWTCVTLSIFYDGSGERIDIVASLRRPASSRPEDLELYEVRAGQLFDLLPAHPTIIDEGTNGEWVHLGAQLCARVMIRSSVLKAVWDRIRAARREKTGGGA